MSDGFLYASDGRDPDEAFAAYAGLYALGAGVARTDQPFAATVRAWRLDGMILFDRRLSGVVHYRDAGRVEENGFDHIVLHAVLAGTLEGSRASAFDRIGAGEVVLLDTRRPSRHTPLGAHMVTVSIARYRLAPVIDRLEDLHGRVLRAADTPILLDYLRSLVRHAGGAAATRSLSHAFVELLGGALADADHRRADRGRGEVIRRELVEQYVQANLHRPGLTAEMIGEALGLSRSSLYRLMEPQGGVTQFVRKKRLAALRDAMERGSELDFPALAERHGFGDEGRMRRLFTAAFGLTPAAYRAEMRAAAGDDTRIAYRRWEGWMSDLS